MADAPGLCARFHKAVELIGGRWTGAVIQILLHGPARYAALRTAVPEISDRMLSERLRELEAEGILVRRVVPETPIRVEYELTEKGRALQPALAAIGEWATEWVTDVPEGPKRSPVPGRAPHTTRRPRTRVSRSRTA